MPHHRVNGSSHYLLTLLLAVLLLSPTVCGSGCGTVAEPTPTAPTVTDQAIPWDEASNHIGETATMAGPVIAAVYADTSNGAPTFLNVGRDYPDPDRLTVVIWGVDRGSFPDAPESVCGSKTIRVTGDVSEYDERAQIETPRQMPSRSSSEARAIEDASA